VQNVGAHVEDSNRASEDKPLSFKRLTNVFEARNSELFIKKKKKTRYDNFEDTGIFKFSHMIFLNCFLLTL
jgi:hypothetical protein